VELDGDQHDLERERDAKRTAYLELHGFRVLRFWNHEVLSEIESVLDDIRLYLGRGGK
jgi:very-short-patch-repair endonuclease